MSSSNFITCHDSTKLHYLREGTPSAPRIIFLHGLGGSSDTFAAIRPHLSQAYDLISLDFPGFGKSPPPTSRPKVADYVAYLHDVITSQQTASSAEGDSAEKVRKNRSCF
jgi:3-oxoadipate enol-lactonase